MIPLYPYSFSVASDRDEVEQWRESYRENIRCQRFLDKRISELFDGWSLHGENDMMKVVKICAERGSQKGFEDEFKRINDNISDLRKIIEVEKTKIRPSLDIDSRLERLFEQIANASADLSFFEDSIIRQLIAQIRVESQEKLSIILHNGFRFAVSI